MVAFFIELIIILYNHFNNYVLLNSVLEFIVRILYGTAMVSIFLTGLYFINNLIIIKLNKYLSWYRKAVTRIFTELFVSTLISFLGSVLLTTISHIIFPYEDGLMKNIINNFLIIAVANIIFLSVLEGYEYFIQWNKLKYESERLEKENAIAKFNILKSQINPHFLFNSLNVLSNIIEVKPEEADDFIEKLSMIYRYITDKIDKQVVTIADEIKFANHYLDLQKMRHIEKFIFEINISNKIMDKYIVPFSLQIVLENCFKHNKFSSENKLNIEINNDDTYLIITNNFNPKLSNKSGGIGLKNLTGQYDLISEKVPEFKLKNNVFYAYLPLIESE